MSLINFIVNFLANFNKFRFLTSRVIRCFGLEIPSTVRINKNLVLAHGGLGVVIHPDTKIGENVKIYQQVTIGRADIWNGNPSDDFEGVSISDDVIICAGAKILTSKKLIIGRGCVIGANSVLINSTGEYEIWAGVPAKKIRSINR